LIIAVLLELIRASGVPYFVSTYSSEVGVKIAYELAPVIADIISAHCPGTSAREEFMRACFRGHWGETREMVQGMLAEPWHLRGYQEARLREFLHLVQLDQSVVLP
jgi:hypothetical protein